MTPDEPQWTFSSDEPPAQRSNTPVAASEPPQSAKRRRRLPRAVETALVALFAAVIGSIVSYYVTVWPTSRTEWNRAAADLEREREQMAAERLSAATVEAEKLTTELLLRLERMMDEVAIHLIAPRVSGTGTREDPMVVWERTLVAPQDEILGFEEYRGTDLRALLVKLAELEKSEPRAVEGLITHDFAPSCKEVPFSLRNLVSVLDFVTATSRTIRMERDLPPGKATTRERDAFQDVEAMMVTGFFKRAWMTVKSRTVCLDYSALSLDEVRKEIDARLIGATK